MRSVLMARCRWYVEPPRARCRCARGECWKSARHRWKPHLPPDASKVQHEDEHLAVHRNCVERMMLSRSCWLLSSGLLGRCVCSVIMHPSMQCIPIESASFDVASTQTSLSTHFLVVGISFVESRCMRSPEGTRSLGHFAMQGALTSRRSSLSSSAEAAAAGRPSPNFCRNF